MPGESSSQAVLAGWAGSWFGVAPTKGAVLWEWKSRLYRVLDAKDQDFSSIVFPCINVGREVKSRFSIQIYNYGRSFVTVFICGWSEMSIMHVVFSKETIPSLLFEVLDRSAL